MRRGLVAAPGYPFLGGCAALIFLGWLLSWAWLVVLGILGGGFFAYFFRDPERPIPEDAGVIVSPADGKVVIVDEVHEDRMLRGPARRVAIFMNVFDCHVNRSPVGATVAVVTHRDGEFRAAFKHDADRGNEQQATLLEGAYGRRVLVVQIAGLLARRIIGWVHPGQRLAKGERLGMICFGSRVDLYLPRDCHILAKVGDRLKAGSSIVGRWT